MTYVAETASVVYHSSMTHGASKKNFEIFTAEEFIAAITQHIPPKGYQMVRYYAWYSNRARGERKKRGIVRPGDELEAARSDDLTVLNVSEYDPPRLTSKTWRQLIHKVWEVDPLVCARCGSEMKIIALIEDPAVIRRILTHLGLWRERNGNERGTAPPEAPAPDADLVYEPVDDGWPGYDDHESPYPYH